MARSNGRGWASVYALLGVVIGLLSINHLVRVDPRAPFLHQITYTVFTFGASVALLYGAYAHYRNPFPAHRYRRITAWVILGALFISSVGVVSLYIGSSSVRPVELSETLLLMTSIGLAIGFLIGSLEARALENAEAAAKTDILESERNRLELINDLFRHYVLNGVTVIEGFAEQLDSSTEGTQSKSARIIRERADHVATLVTDIGFLTRSDWGGAESTPVDIGTTIRNKFTSVCQDGTTLTLPEHTQLMVANVGYENGIHLIAKGISHALEDEGQVAVEMKPNDEIIVISAHPINLPGRLHEELLKPVASEIGLELFLAKQILEPAIELDASSAEEDRIEIVLNGEFVES